MDCSLREALHNEQSIAPKNALQKNGQNSLHKSSFCVSKTA